MYFATNSKKERKLISRRLVQILLYSIVCMIGLSACGSTPYQEREPSLGYLNQKYRVCRDNCPNRTRKELDDSEDALLAFRLPTLTPNMAIPEKAMNATKDNIDTIDIYFDFGQSQPNAEGRKELLRFVEMATRKIPEKIELDGHTDDIGTQIYNSKLAIKRADFVAKWIKEHGINVAISITARGECCHAVPYNKAESSFIGKRRVSIKQQTN